MERSQESVLKSVLLNPMVWVGWILTYCTLQHYDYIEVFDIFLSFETWRNLLIGCTVYVALFDIKYTQNRTRIDIVETLKNIFEAMNAVVLTWIISLFLIANYNVSGSMLEMRLRNRYEKMKAEKVLREAEEAESGIRVEQLESVSVVDPETGIQYNIKATPGGNLEIEAQ